MHHTDLNDAQVLDSVNYKIKNFQLQVKLNQM